jgi:hypothetical protein
MASHRGGHGDTTGEPLATVTVTFHRNENWTPSSAPSEEDAARPVGGVGVELQTDTAMPVPMVMLCERAISALVRELRQLSYGDGLTAQWADGEPADG